MGQAKRRGTKAERVAAALETKRLAELDRDLRRLARAKAEQDRLASLTAAELESERREREKTLAMLGFVSAVLSYYPRIR